MVKVGSMESATIQEWEPLQKVAKQVSETGSARVYIWAVECCFKMETAFKGFQRYASEKHLQAVNIRNRMDSNGWHSTPAIMAVVKSPEEFETLWRDILQTSYLRSKRTGCSFVLSDGQGFEISVMPESHRASSM